MDFIKGVVRHVSPIFLISSPITSYADQIYSMHRNRSSQGFSIDVPLVMFIASVTKSEKPPYLKLSPMLTILTRVFYWFGARYDFSLFLQASLMIIVQIVCLHIALIYRPQSLTGSDLQEPFQPVTRKRPYEFWQWRSIRPYWTFLAYYTLTLAALHAFLGKSTAYISFIGYFALAVEALLPVPQVLANHRNKSCKGFRVSVLINWLIGDVMKMSYFFLSGNSVTLPFKLCGSFQFICDVYLGVQYLQFGDGVTGAPNGWTKH